MVRRPSLGFGAQIMTHRTKRIIRLALLGGILCLVGAYSGGSVLIAPAPSAVGPAPHDLPLEEVRIDSASGSSLSGWLISAPSSCAAVVLMHGIRDNRRAMLGRARFLFEAGYDVLLFDFQSHGESI
jgi:pimeloyl-ACP methyl ester carboxylesterase